MSKVFTSKLNPVNGKMEWVLMEDAFDYNQQIARSAYADMLHDTDRNKKYYDALKIAVSKVHALGKKAYVLDIGTGTGILSMMAARCGADAVFACEFFEPMSRCAEKIIHLNGYSDKITIIHKGSTQLTVGENGDLPHRANILVTEVFDTELIGEGAIKTFTHAQRELLEENPIVIPCVGRVYATVFQSSVVNSFNKLQDISIADTESLTLKIPETVKNCTGSASVHDIQLSQLSVSTFKLLTFPEIVLSFDWTGKEPIVKKETKFNKVKATRKGTAHGVFMWWDLFMDPDKKILLTCEPKWRGNYDNENNPYPWRDHWMQAIYYVPRNIPVEQGQEFTLVTNHDEYSLWFDISVDSNLKSTYEVPVCDCGLHLTSRMRVGMMNDTSRVNKFSRVLSNMVTNETVCLNLSECSLLGHLIALSGAKQVYSLESNHIFQRVLENVAQFNNIQSKIQWISLVENIQSSISANKEKVSLIVAEPYFSSSILPWHNLQFWYIKEDLTDILSDNVQMVPGSVEFYLIPVQFEDLWKIRAPIHEVEGFNLKPFDNIIQEAITITDDVIDAQPLWEYTSIALSEPKKYLTLNLSEKAPSTNVTCSDQLNFETEGICNGIVLWVKWILCKNRNISISTGAIDEITVGKKITWDMYSKQGIYFVKDMPKVTSKQHLSYDIKFYTRNANFEYNFKIV